jgi:hypothetical protein
VATNRMPVWYKSNGEVMTDEEENNTARWHVSVLKTLETHISHHSVAYRSRITKSPSRVNDIWQGNDRGDLWSGSSQWGITWSMGTMTLDVFLRFRRKLAQEVNE